MVLNLYMELQRRILEMKCAIALYATHMYAVRNYSYKKLLKNYSCSPDRANLLAPRIGINKNVLKNSPLCSDKRLTEKRLQYAFFIFYLYVQILVDLLKISIMYVV